MGPFLHSEWLKYGFELFDLCHEWAYERLPLDWSKVYFRHKDDFIGRTFNLFYPIAFLMTPQLEGIEIKHGVANDGSRGVDLFETLLNKNIDDGTVLRNKGQMHTVPRPYTEFLTQIHKIPAHNFDYQSENRTLQARDSRFARRAKLMKKRNKIRTWQHATHFFPRKKQNFETWYPKVKQVPFWFDFKKQAWQMPFFYTDPRIEKAQAKLFNETIEKWLKTGCLFIISDKDDKDLVSPCVLANVQLPNGPPPEPGKKPRLCHDGTFEKHIEKYGFPCKLDDLRTALKTLKKGQLMSVSDDMRGFHQLGLNFESSKLTVFSYQNILFAYSVCPFGSPKIPAVFQRYNLLVVNYSRSLGQRNLLYLDDRALIDDPSMLQNGIGPSSIITTALSVSVGGYISLDKSSFNPIHRQKYLGLILDTNQGSIEVPHDKWEKFKQMIQTSLKENGCTFKMLERLRGKAVSFILCNPMTKLFIRVMNRTIAEANKQKFPPTHWISFTNDLAQELQEWIKLDHLKMKHYWANLTASNKPPNRIIFTDASSFAAAATVFDENGVAWEMQWYFTEYEQSCPIYYKEGLAILWTLQEFSDLLKHKTILSFCDNESLTLAYIAKGSKTELMNKIVTEIYQWLHKNKATLKMIWISTHKQLADEPSRRVQWNEEFLPSAIFKDICEQWNIKPSIDVMATRANTKCPYYITLGRDLNPVCLAYDFFSFPPSRLENKLFYIFPPKNLLDQTAQHLEKYYKYHKFLLVYHSFGVIPHSITWLKQNAHRHEKLTKFSTIIPDEVRLEAHDTTYWGFWNTKKQASYALYYIG